MCRDGKNRRTLLFFTQFCCESKNCSKNRTSNFKKLIIKIFKSIFSHYCSIKNVNFIYYDIGSLSRRAYWEKMSKIWDWRDRINIKGWVDIGGRIRKERGWHSVYTWSTQRGKTKLWCFTGVYVFLSGVGRSLGGETGRK